MAKGYFVPPTVFADVRDDMRIAQEEIFGPVISAIPFTDIEEVIERANADLSASAAACGRATSARRTGSPRRSAPARSGSTATRRWIPAVPFGGYKMSGYGRESGMQHVEEYLNVKAVWIKT